MLQGVYQSAAALNGLQRWNELVAQNIASSSSAGFKGHAVSFEAKPMGALGMKGPTGASVTEGMVQPLIQGRIRFDQGEIRPTSDPLHVAIEGEGFLQLQRPDGSTVFTRDGQLHLTSDMRLVSKEGFAVMGDGGPIQLIPGEGVPLVDATGNLFQGDQPVGAIAVYRFADTAHLTPVRGGFQPHPEGPAPERMIDPLVRQGFLEGSNVSAVHEMVHLMAINHASQLNEKLISTYDQSLERAVQVLGGAS
ncbi:MAG: flagellar hook-basal body protein [Puniceicoccaceae bacterium]|nr:MAG: flagellar hook-basal body protein [Puniceicoccaceae bacterium]